MGKKIKRLFLGGAIVISALLSVLVVFGVRYNKRIYPRTYVADQDIGGLSKEEAFGILASKIRAPNGLLLVYGSGDLAQEFEIQPATIEFNYDFEKSVDKAFQKGRGTNLVKNLHEIFRPSYEDLEISLNEKILNEQLSVIAGQITVAPIKPNVSLGSAGLIVNKGKAGEKINTEEIKGKILSSLRDRDSSPIAISTIIVDPTISDMEAEVLTNRARVLIKKQLILKYDNQEINYKDYDIVPLLAPYGGYEEEKLDQLIQGVSKKVNREPQNPTFVFSEGRVSEFSPAKDGLIVKEEELRVDVVNSLKKLENEDSLIAEIEIPSINKASEYKTGDINNMGIIELVGKGVSHFRGSISSRIYNITLAASRLNGVLIKPGEVFSFNGALGDVSKLTGYKEAYIIKGNQTILGDGGGVCQVSTTLFRAALAAGLPIIERRAHAYRVGYYEQDSSPGMDATVYAPTTDLKIKNDTPAHVLIQTRVDTKTATLTFELYGTKDGREATISKPVITDSTPPPDDLYVDDPTFPGGQTKQIEYKAWGAKVRFDYNVKRDGETIYRKTFYSNYRPWAAVYLRGTGPVQP